MKMVRPPIVVILGHVDHGKTTLLDYLRSTQIAAREAGGITQHIRSFQLLTPGSDPVTFIDTPGHAAFSKLRQRGIQIADLAVLVVAGDDGVKPQTLESLDFINASKLPYLVAITKIDLPASDPDRVRTQLAEHDVIVEELGGHISSVGLSAKTGKGVPEFLELVHLLSDLNPHEADPDGTLETLVLESRLDSRTGPLATVLVKSGTLKTGLFLYQSQPIGKVRALIDFDGKKVESALPSQPVEILGLSDVPEVGSVISSMPVNTSPIRPSPGQRPDRREILGEGLEGEVLTKDTRLSVVLRTDVAGSLEAITAALPPQVLILSGGTGDFTENDVSLAKTSGARLFGFNVRVSGSVAKLAEVEKIPIQNFKIIYELLESVEKMLHPAVTETILGEAEIIAEFKINSDRIAGAKVISGQISKNHKVRLMRKGVAVAETKIKSLKIAKNDVPQVKTGAEFGLVLAPYLDFRVGDHIIAFENAHGPS